MLTIAATMTVADLKAAVAAMTLEEVRGELAAAAVTCGRVKSEKGLRKLLLGLARTRLEGKQLEGAQF